MGLEAAEILARMADAYGRCRSYRDAGVVTSTITTGTRSRTERKPFTTAFIRPDRFKFEFRHRRGDDHWDQFAVWMENGLAHAWWSIQDSGCRPDGLDLQLAAGTGISGGSAHTVPRLLLPEEVSGWCLTALRDLARMPEVEVDGRRCLVVVGKHSRLGEHRIYLDAASLLVRQIEQAEQVLPATSLDIPESVKESMPPGMFEQTMAALAKAKMQPSTHRQVTTYVPEIDVEISAEELMFVPPG